MRGDQMRALGVEPAIEGWRPMPAAGRTSRLAAALQPPWVPWAAGGVLYDRAIEETLPKGDQRVISQLSQRTIDRPSLRRIDA
jgi:hypothetical protein